MQESPTSVQCPIQAIHPSIQIPETTYLPSSLPPLMCPSSDSSTSQTPLMVTVDTLSVVSCIQTISINSVEWVNAINEIHTRKVPPKKKEQTMTRHLSHHHQHNINSHCHHPSDLPRPLFVITSSFLCSSHQVRCALVNSLFLLNSKNQH